VKNNLIFIKKKWYNYYRKKYEREFFMKQEFLNFVESLMNANPDLTKQLMTDDI
jgi:hypothetical protein